MSTLAFAALTTNREDSPPSTSSDAQSIGVRTYIDAVAALVPAEVLVLHAAVLTVTTKTEGVVTTITDRPVLAAAFWGLIVLAVGVYVVGRLSSRAWDRWDPVRMLIPACSFVTWTMLQRSTAFDAVWPELSAAARTVIALFAAVLLGAAASILAYRIDQKPPPQKPTTLPPVAAS